MPEDTREFAIDYEPVADDADAVDSERATLPTAPVEIPLEALSASAAAGIIDAFILREGTDYGEVEASHASKVAEVRRKLESGEVTITFDPATESVTLMTRVEWTRLAHARP